MAPRAKPLYCCCQMFPIVCGTYLIALHSFVQGAYGVCLALTSSYRPENVVVNHVVVASHICLFPTGICIFCTALYESWMGLNVSCFITVLVTIFNLVMDIIYYVTYLNFKANSQLDKDIFYLKPDDWVGSSDLTFTMWHILGFILILMAPVWWYYSYILFQLAQWYRIKSDTPNVEFSA